MAVDPDIKLEFANAGVAPGGGNSISCRGFAAEYVLLGSAEGFSYSVTGRHHYAAIHDILLDDGEIFLDGGRADGTRDLRRAISFIPRGCPVSGWSQPAPRMNSFTALWFDPDTLRDDLGLRFSLGEPRPLLHIRNARLQTTLEKLEAMLRDGAPDDLYAEAICMVAAVEIFECGDSLPIGKLSDRQMRAISEYIDAWHGRSITISDLAQVAGLSRFHFARIFKHTTGLSPYQFVTGSRIDRAARMLVSSQVSVEAVASAVGFNSASQFGRAFRKIIGQSPQAFRRSAGR